MKYLIILLSIVTFTSCDPATINSILKDRPLSTSEIVLGLKEALEKGIGEGSEKLSIRDGYYKSIYKILLPEQAQKITDKLSVIPGFSNVEDILIEKINRAAEDAARSAKPIFVDAIKTMTFDDAMGILMGEQNAATSYLDRKTHNALYTQFQPVILESLNNFNALDYWEDAVNTYNKIPFVEKMNPRLDDYVAEKALDGLFNMVEKKEIAIRTNISERTSEILRKVFAKQDS